jgi:hypothetical protein
MTRTEQILQLRAEIPTDTERSSLPKEEFQNKTLRPILKLQNDVLVAFFKSQLKGAVMPDFKVELTGFVQQRLQKDLATRNTLLGMVLGLLSEEEMEGFIADKNEISKRIMDMMAQRIIDQLSKEL